ncbi:MAG: Fic family protein [Candidatus Aenigmatarchaeota archaeon]
MDEAKTQKFFMEFLTESILEVHHIATGYEPGDKMLRDRGTLEFLVYSSLRKCGSDTDKIAASLLHGIATMHPFMDGNKRTALLTGMVLIMLAHGEQNTEIIRQHFSKIDWNKREDAIVKFMLETADCKHDENEVLEFLKRNFVKPPL